MKLNLGSGMWPTDLPDWVNIDLPWEGVKPPDVWGDAFDLPFPDDTFDAAYCGHVLEHVEWDLIPVFLEELCRTLKSPAVVMFVGPDIEKARATNQPQNILDAITDLNSGPGGHKWVATEALTLEAVQRGRFAAAAWDVANVTPPEWPNVSQAPWQCAVLGIYRAEFGRARTDGYELPRVR